MIDSLLLRRLDWCDFGFWRCQLKRLDVVSHADVDAEECADESLVDILKLKFGWDINVDFWLRFWRWILNFWYDLKEVYFDERSTKQLGPLCIWQCLLRILGQISKYLSIPISCHFCHNGKYDKNVTLSVSVVLRFLLKLSSSSEVLFLSLFKDSACLLLSQSL